MNKFIRFNFLLLCSFISCLPNAAAYYIKGNLDKCHLDKGYYCYAWACAPEYPDRLIFLRLSIDGKLMFSSSILANFLREDAVEAVEMHTETHFLTLMEL